MSFYSSLYPFQTGSRSWDDRELTAGDAFDLRMVLNNPDATALHCEAYVVLDVFGSYFCWPSWSNIDVKLDCKSYNVDPPSAADMCDLMESHTPALNLFTVHLCHK